MFLSELTKKPKGQYGTIYTHALSDKAIYYSRIGMLARLYIFNGKEHKSLKDAFESMKRYVGAPELE